MVLVLANICDFDTGGKFSIILVSCQHAL